MNENQKGIILAFLSSIGIASCYIISKTILNYINIETSITIWFFFASLFYLAYFLLTGREEHLKKITRNWKKLSILALSTAAGGILWFYGISLTEPTRVAFISRFSTVFVILMGVIFLKERFTHIEVSGISLAVLGAFILTSSNGTASLTVTLIVLASAFFFALSSFLAKVFVKDIDSLTLAGGRTLYYLLFISIYTFSTGSFQIPPHPNAYLLAALGGFAGAFGAFILFYQSLELIQVSKSISVKTSEPFLTALFSFLIFSTLLDLNQIVGGILIVAGILVLTLGHRIKSLYISAFGG